MKSRANEKSECCATLTWDDLKKQNKENEVSRMACPCFFEDVKNTYKLSRGIRIRIVNTRLFRPSITTHETNSA